MVKKIALEEHFLDPATEPYWRPTMADVALAKTAQLYASLTDFGEQRLQMMDKTGIARAVLAIAGPGVQAERDTAAAVRAARASNDFLVKEVQKRPDRYSGFAHLAMQDEMSSSDRALETWICHSSETFDSGKNTGSNSGGKSSMCSIRPISTFLDGLLSARTSAESSAPPSRRVKCSSE